MNPNAPADLTNWQPILTTHNLTPDHINTDTGDPHDHTAIARHEINRANQHIPHIYRHATTDHPDIRTWADTLAQHARNTRRLVPHITAGRSLLLLGPTGVGKTHQAYGALRYLAPTGIRLRWTATSAADMYAALRPRHGIDTEQEFRRYRDAPLLLIDDLGAGRAPTDFTEEINFRLVNHRYENQLPTIFTSNVLPRELADRVGDRVASRLIEMCDRVVIQGQDRRRQAAA